MTDQSALMDRRGIYIRIGADSNLIGRQFVRLDKNTTVWYNKDPETTPKLMDVLKEHIEANDGRLLYPFNYQISFKSICYATWFIIHGPTDDYVIGRIQESGIDYVKGMDDHDGYTVPKELTTRSARHWVKISDAEYHHGFPADEWCNSRDGAYQESVRTTLADSRAATSCLLVTHI